MSEIPFGFGKPNDENNGGENGDNSTPNNPFGFGGDIGDALHRFADLMSWQGGPVNWDLAKDIARQAAATGDRSVVDTERAAVADAVRLAELWLDPATSFSSATTSTRAWSRAEWIEATLPTWKTLVEPVATKVVDAFGSGLSGIPGIPGMPGFGEADVDPGELPAHMQQMAGPLMSMMRQMGGVMFGGQVGQALGALAREVVSSTDVGLPLAAVGTAALLPAGIEEFGAGLELPADEVRLFVALREAACHRLFAGVPWLRGRVLAAVEDYARGINVDMAHMQDAMGSIDPTNPEALQEALAGGLFEPQDTPAQQAALLRLETLLALIEGWIDDVVGQAASGRPRAPTRWPRRSAGVGRPADRPSRRSAP